MQMAHVGIVSRCKSGFEYRCTLPVIFHGITKLALASNVCSRGDAEAIGKFDDDSRE